MRSVLICVFLTLFTKEDHVSGNVFRPTPIPLNEWRPYDSWGRAGTLHETVKPASSPSVVAVPAHYWEDALRHSVYLTLVRDKIDQLIAKGDTIEHEYNHNSHVSKEVDDKDLWDKIKAAPFDRIKGDVTTTYGDVTILARGRLLEESGGFRFTEDDKIHEKCNDDKCMDGVKAFWSVKRIRQRDQEISPGKNHYELTFSIMSQMPKKQKKPYEHPIRTFTVQESANNRVTESPQGYRNLEKSALQISRPERAIWFHKNIAPTTHQRKPKYHSELDRLFSSLFDYDDDDGKNYEEPKKYNQNTHQRPSPQYPKIVYGGGFSSEQQTQIKPLPYPYKPHNFKYQSYPFTTSSMGLIQQYSIDQENSGINNPHITQADYMSAGYNNVKIFTRPAVLPTPLPPLTSSPKESFVKKSNTIKYNTSENATNTFDVAKNVIQYNKIKTHEKGNHFPEHLRPPIYNAPPGVFTMDKKPLKPMPPLKIPATKPLRVTRPVDFRPSPQVLDVQFSEPDPLFDTVFRPMTFNSVGNDNSTKTFSLSKESENAEKKIQTLNSSTINTFKKENNAKIQQHTTYTPEIITAHNSSEDGDVMEWADILSVFAKTTPMVSQKSKNTIAQITTPLPSSTTIVTLVSTQITSDIPSTTAISTTRKLKKRTRPPPKFNKTERIKKHKRVTTTSSTTTTTELPLTTINTDGLKGIKILQNLIPKATTVTGTTKISWKPSTKLTSTTPPSTTSTVTNSFKITSTANKPVEHEIIPTPHSKSTNRFRQSTLIVKGTSLKHDRWSVTNPTPEKLRPALTTSPIHTQRRKGSNFQGYVSSTPKNLDKEQNRHDHIDHGINIVNTHEQKLSSPKIKTKEKDIEIVSNETLNETALKATGEGSVDAEEQVISKEKNHYIYEESQDDTEYIFQNISDINNDKNNEVVDTEEILTTEKIISTPNPNSKSKKCKKRHQNFSTKDETQKILEKNESVNTNIPTMTLTTPSMIKDLLNDFSSDDLEQSKKTITTTTTTLDLNEEQSETHPNDDLEKLLDSFNDDKYEKVDDEEYKNDGEDGEDDDIDDDHEKESTYEDEDTSYRLNEDSYHHLHNKHDGKRPMSFLELIGME